MDGRDALKLHPPAVSLIAPSRWRAPCPCDVAAQLLQPLVVICFDPHWWQLQGDEISGADISSRSSPVVPFPLAFQVAGAPRGTHWTVDAVSSNGGLLAPKSCHLRGVRAAQVPQKLSPFPRRARVSSVFKISRYLAQTRANTGFLASRGPLRGRTFSLR